MSHKSFTNNFDNTLLVKSLSYNPVNRQVNIEYFNNAFIVNKATYEADNLLLQTKDVCGCKFTAYSLEDNLNKFLIVDDKANATLDSKLLHEIFNSRSQDPLVESILLDHKNLLNLHCPFMSNPKTTIDWLLREKMLSEKEDISKLNQTEKHIKMLSLPDHEVASYQEQQLAQAQNSQQDSLENITDFLNRHGIQKSQGIVDYVAKTFEVKTLDHFKSLGMYELTEASKANDLSFEETDRLLSKVKNL